MGTNRVPDALFKSCPRNVSAPREAPAGASTPLGNGFASVALNVRPRSLEGTMVVVCEKPGWKLPAMMKGTVYTPRPARTTVASFTLYARPTRGSTLLVSAFQKPGFASDANCSPPRTLKADGAICGIGLVA